MASTGVGRSKPHDPLVDSLRLNSYQTALCIIPPAHVCREIDKLRYHNDKAYGKWPPHINVLYPFVAPESLPQAEALIASALEAEKPARLSIDLLQSNSFSHRHNATIYLEPARLTVHPGERTCALQDEDHQGRKPSPSRELGVHDLHRLLQEAFEPHRSKSNQSYQPHLSVGQTSLDRDSIEQLKAKAECLLPICWQHSQLAILRRDQSKDSSSGPANRMKLWNIIDIPLAKETPNKPCATRSADWSKHEGSADEAERSNTTPREQTNAKYVKDHVIDRPTIDRAYNPPAQDTYRFIHDERIWRPLDAAEVQPASLIRKGELSVASYNVQLEQKLSSAREASTDVARAILSEKAVADVLILQDVTDDVLSNLLGHEVIREQWSYATHGPPHWPGIGPLPSLHNVVALSRFPFTWDWVPFERKHHGAIVLKLIATFKNLTETPAGLANTRGPSDSAELILAGVRLPFELSDAAIATRSSQIEVLLSYLRQNHPHDTWVIAGDLNMPLSPTALDFALKAQAVSDASAKTLGQLYRLLSELDLTDGIIPRQARAGTRESGDELLNGPLLSDSQMIFNKDQVLTLALEKLDLFLPSARARDTISTSSATTDQCGLRATFRIRTDLDKLDLIRQNAKDSTVGWQKAPSSLGNAAQLQKYLAYHGEMPSEADIERRKSAFSLLKSILQQTSNISDADTHEISSTEAASRDAVSLVVVPVGSYKLGVWGPSSDIDCLCVGPISTKTFFSLARQRLRRAFETGVRAFRTIEAISGTMMNLDIQGIKVDLQYCPAVKVTELWPNVASASPTDSMFDLPILSLTKLKAYRDDEYFVRTISNMESFQAAHRLIRLWAKRRGIFSAKVGYLGGIHITLLLVSVYRLHFQETQNAASADILRAFFDHYFSFNWAKDMVFDSLFHSSPPSYKRTSKEPMIVIAPHEPVINIAQTASEHSLRTLSDEFQRASSIMMLENPTWDLLIGHRELSAPTDLPDAANDFLTLFQSYIKIDMLYFGPSLAKCSRLVGWMEARCVTLLLDLRRKLPQIHARIWPSRFAPTDANAAGTKEYHACYLIGMDKQEETATLNVNPDASGNAESSTRNVPSVKDRLDTMLKSFADKLRSKERYFDPAHSWIDITNMPQSALGDLKLDERDWAEIPEQEELSQSDNDDDDDEAPPEPHSKAGTHKSPSPSDQPHPKLRPAADVLNRIRWDSNMNSEDFVVGYEDRFLGAQEIALEQWKSEQTDEVFIPQHRILYFKRRSDGVCVWDRRSRVDRIFGSGVPG